MAADQVHINGTQVHPAQAGAYGTRNVLIDGTDFSDVPETLFLQDNPTKDGQILLGSWAGARPFTVMIATDMVGAGTEAKGKDEAIALNRLCSPVNGLVEFKVVRDNPAGGIYTRVLKAVPTGRAHWRWSRGNDGPGVRANGNVLWQREFLAPYPWWRGSVEDETNTTSGTTPLALVCTRLGDIPCGVKISISTAGTLGQVTITDGVNTMVAVATFNGTPKVIDWHHTTPGQVDWTTGITFTGRPNLEMHSATTTLTFTPVAGSSGTHTILAEWYPLWEMA